MEVRVFLSYLQNEEMDELMAQENIDFHAETAKTAFDMVEGHDEFKFYRQMAKNITFGIIYGIGNKRLALQLRTSPKEASSYKRKYLQGSSGNKCRYFK
jgi:DNA polymerase I-like protein with 3'-5' exonuclease and polymerase domains